MKQLLKPILLAGIAIAAAPQIAMAAPPAAAASTGVQVQGLGVADLEAVVASSNASRAAQQQRPVTYKAQIDSYQARGRQVQAQLQPLVEKFNRDRAAPNANQASLQTQAATIQQIQEGAQREMNEIIKPVAYSEAYVTEQIADKLDGAVKTAMASSRVTILLRPDAILATGNAYNISPAILAELNRVMPSAQLVPPTGWEPRQVREERAQQAAQQGQPAAAGAAPATAPAAPSPVGR